MYIWIFLYKYSFVIYRNDAGWDLRVITGLQKPGSREISERQDDSVDLTAPFLFSGDKRYYGYDDKLPASF